MRNRPQTNLSYQCRFVKNADHNLAEDWYYIACEFLGDARAFIDSVPYDVNVLHRPMFVAEKPNGYVLGFVMGKMIDNKSAEISALYVTARAHRNGIGATLLQNMEGYLRDRGVANVQLVSRPMAVHFYTEHGYTRRQAMSHYLQKTL